MITGLNKQKSEFLNFVPAMKSCVRWLQVFNFYDSTIIQCFASSHTIIDNFCGFCMRCKNWTQSGKAISICSSACFIARTDDQLLIIFGIGVYTSTCRENLFYVSPL